jgi:hypothetical protein
LLIFSRVLFPALIEVGAGKQNAVVVIVVPRYAGLAVVASLDLLSSSIVTMMAVSLTRLKPRQIRLMRSQRAF